MNIAVTLLLLVATPDRTDFGPIPRVRGASISETRLIEDLLARSSTARDLVAEIDGTDLIVYVQFTVDRAAGEGATRLAGTYGTHRYLRIVLGAATHPKDRGPLLAHELQHAVEIGRAPDVRDNDAMRRLYARIGEDRTARSAFETTAAREIGARVSRELTGAAARARPATAGP